MAKGFDPAGLGRGSTRLSEGVLGGLVQMAGWGADFPAAIAPHLARLGIAGPGNFREVQGAGPVQSFRTAADRILLRHQNAAALLSAIADIDRTRLVSLNLSDARDALVLEGGSVEDVLARLAAFDFSLSAFAVGHFAQIGVDQIGCLVHRRATDVFEVLVPRSFTRHLQEAFATICT